MDEHFLIEKTVVSRSAVIIPCFDRLDDLQIVLTELMQVANGFDIHVYDDCSPHAHIQELCANYAGVTYHRSPCNLGVIGIRNLAMSELRDHYDYMFHFDDDSHPLRRDTIEHAVTFLESNADIAVLSFPVIAPGEIYNGEGATDIFTYIGCGNVWRSAATHKIGLFSPLFYRQGEEMEHSFRVWKSGFRVVRLNAYPVVHWQSTKNRNTRKTLALDSTAYLKWTLINWQGSMLWIELARWIAFTGRRLFDLSWGVWLKDISDAQKGLCAAIKARAPIPHERVDRIRALYLTYRGMIK